MITAPAPFRDKFFNVLEVNTLKGSLSIGKNLILLNINYYGKMTLISITFELSKIYNSESKFK